MPPALWLIALPLSAVPVVYVLRRVGWGAIVAAAVALLSAWLAAQLPTGVVLDLLGRSIELDRLSQIVLALLFVTTATLFLIPALLPPLKGKVARPLVVSKERKRKKSDTFQIGTAWREGRTFYPAGLAVLGLFVAASLSHHLGIVAMLVEGAVILTVFVIQGGRLDSTRAALRFLTLMSLATPLFLLAAWQIDVYQLSGGVDTAGGLGWLTLLVGLGFALWLAVVPFHGWLTMTAAESSPVAAGFVLIAFPIVAFLTLIHLLVDFPWLVNSSQLVEAMIIAGVATAFLGGVLASVQRGFSELLGYAALYDLGCTLAVLGLGGPSSIVMILVSLTVRALALTLIAVSTSTLRLRAPSDGFAELRGVAQQTPIATGGLVLGGLTLAGIPFTAGFAPHWQLLQAMAELDPRGSVLLALAGLGVTIGYLRGVRTTLQPRDPAKNIDPAATKARVVFSVQEPLWLLVMISLLMAATTLLGLFPAVLIQPFRILSAGISIPIQ